MANGVTDAQTPLRETRRVVPGTAKDDGYGIAAFATACFFLNPAVWKYQELTAWVAIAVLVPAPFEVWARVRRSRRQSASK